MLFAFYFSIKLPKYKESYVITIADKYVTLLENKNYIVNRKFYCHAYLFLSMLFIKLF